MFISQHVPHVIGTDSPLALTIAEYNALANPIYLAIWDPWNLVQTLNILSPFFRGLVKGCFNNQDTLYQLYTYILIEATELTENICSI